MEILILEYSCGNLIRVKLTEELKTIFEKDSEEFLQMLSYKYKFRMQDVYWMTSEQEDEVHDLAEEMEEEGRFLRVCDHCGKLMSSGYYLAGEYACSDECCLALYNGDKQQMEEDLSHYDEVGADFYYTEWESSIND